MEGFLAVVALLIAISAIVMINNLSRRHTHLANEFRKLTKALADQAASRPTAVPSTSAPETSVVDAAVVTAQPAPEAAADPPLPEAALTPGPEGDVPLAAAPPRSKAWSGSGAKWSSGKSNWSTGTAKAYTRAAAQPSLAQRPGLEQRVASRWFVWIGAVAMAFGGLLFVKYAYDNGLIPPVLQVLVSLAVGAGLIGAGEFMRRAMGPGTEPNYVPAGLSAAGLAICFGSIYSAYALYEIISPGFAFLGLGLVAVGALALSLRQGPLIGALGLAGSMITPALITSPNPSAWGLFIYLLIIVAACFAVLRQRPWWWLGHAAIAGSAIWALLWQVGPFVVQDVIPVGLFALAFAAISLFALSGRAVLASTSGSLFSPHHMTPALQLGSVGIVSAALVLSALVITSGHRFDALVIFTLAMAFVAAISWLKQGDTLAVLPAATLTWVVLMAWQEASFWELAMDERGLWSTVLGPRAGSFLGWMLAEGAGFTLLGLLGYARRRAAATWGVLAAGASFLFLFGAWARVESALSPTVWALLACAAAVALLFALLRDKDSANAEAAALPPAALAGASAALLVFAADRWFDNVAYTLAVAALATAYAWGSLATRIKPFGAVAAGLASFTALRLFIAREIWTEAPALPWGQHWPLYGYGLPVALFYLGSRWLHRAGLRKPAVALEAICLGLGISLVSLELRVLIAGGINAAEPTLVEVSAHLLAWLGAAYGLLYRQQAFSSTVLRWGARVLLVVSCLGLVFLNLFRLNPVVTEAPLPGTVLFNGLLLAYLAPMALLVLLVQKLDAISWQRFRPLFGGLALVLGMAFVTLETKRLFQGPVLVLEPRSIAEDYAYSLVWLLTGLALFAAGIRLGRAYVRYAGLAVVALVICKVFLLDMSGLRGLFRIMSLFGLGLSLVGMGWAYTRFVPRHLGSPQEEGSEPPADPPAPPPPDPAV